MEKPIKQLIEFSIINIDKPQGPTSFDVSELVKEKLSFLGVRKTSHFGTLDPKVTGVLPIALNRACKLTGFFLGHDKTYVGIIHTINDLSIKELQEIINKKFLGKIKQTPPRKSNVKRQEREREILDFIILEKEEKNFLFRAKVQGGTYIRKLCSDLGEEKEVGGAHMLELRRTIAGLFNEDTSITLYDLEESIDKYKQGDEKRLRQILKPAEEKIKEFLPVIQVKKESLTKLLTGKPIFLDDLEKNEKVPEIGNFAVFYKDQFIEIAHFSKEGDIIARPDFVLN